MLLWLEGNYYMMKTFRGSMGKSSRNWLTLLYEIPIPFITAFDRKMKIKMSFRMNTGKEKHFKLLGMVLTRYAYQPS